MSGGSRGVLLAASTAMVIGLTSISTQAANWFEKLTGLGSLGYDSVLPLCDEPFALSKIQWRFAEKESRFWASTLELIRFENIRETAFRPWVDDSIPRRFCRARVLVSDGKWRPVYYSIVEDGGAIGATWGVEWCVVGLDRNWANNPACRMAKP